jgi:uncharacterized membrane protein
VYNRIIDRFAQKTLPFLFVLIAIISTVIHYTTAEFKEPINWNNSIGIDLLSILLAIPLFIHCCHNFGKTRASLLFFTTSIFMAGMESLWVILGKLKILGDSYNYGAGLLWFFDVPLIVGIGWFLWVYVYYYLVSQVFSQASLLMKSFLCGFFAMMTDLWIDPSVVNYHLVSGSNTMWEWQATMGPVLFTVPVYNYFGWFLAAFSVVYLFGRIWDTEHKEKIVLRHAVLQLVAGWILYAVFAKSVQIFLDTFLNGRVWFSLNFSEGTFDFFKIIAVTAALGILPAVFVLFYMRSKQNQNVKIDIWYLAAYTVMIGFNLTMTLKLQFAFESTYLIFIHLITMVFPYTVLILYFKNAGRCVSRSHQFL